MLTLSQRLKLASVVTSTDNFARHLLTSTTNSSQTGNTDEICSSNIVDNRTELERKRHEESRDSGQYS